MLNIDFLNSIERVSKGEISENILENILKIVILQLIQHLN